MLDISFLLRVFDAGFGDVYLERAVSQGISIEHADRLVCFGLIGHGDKSEALGETRGFVHDEIDGVHGPGLCEEGGEFFLSGGLVQVTCVNSNIHFVAAFFQLGWK